MALPAFLINKAISLATKSEGDPFRHSAILFDTRTNEIMSKGINHPRIRCSEARFFHKFSKFHSETNAIWRCKKPFHKYMGLITVRINNKGMLRLAKPCSECLALIKKVGVRDVYYSTESGIVKLEE